MTRLSVSASIIGDGREYAVWLQMRQDDQHPHDSSYSFVGGIYPTFDAATAALLEAGKGIDITVIHTHWTWPP